jgi:hypothetical protein
MSLEFGAAIADVDRICKALINNALRIESIARSHAPVGIRWKPAGNLIHFEAIGVSPLNKLGLARWPGSAKLSHILPWQFTVIEPRGVAV